MADGIAIQIGGLDNSACKTKNANQASPIEPSTEMLNPVLDIWLDIDILDKETESP
ncbi:MAG: hypothetical protein KJS91_11900 [Planctomycetes bacterium]|nr:hypothetical protein [Planctomycetota bacterium]